MGDGNVSVHADDDQVEDAGGAGPDVHTEPYEAEIPDRDGLSVMYWGGAGLSPSEDPAVHHLVYCREREDQNT